MEQTIRDLCKRVAATGGFDTDNDSVIAYQDLIGHATMEENAELANEPALMESYYRIYGVAYGTIAAIKFYMQNSNKVIDMDYQLNEYKASFEAKCKELEFANEKIKAREKEVEKLCENMEELKGKISGYKASITERDREIMKLKAKLYDLMQK